MNTKPQFYIYAYADYVFDYENKIYGATFRKEMPSPRVTVIDGFGQIIAYALIDYNTMTAEIEMNGSTHTISYVGIKMHALAYTIVEMHHEEIKFQNKLKKHRLLEK